MAMSSDSGSTPLASTIQPDILADVAQLVEHFTRNEGVGGSNPSISTITQLCLIGRAGEIPCSSLIVFNINVSGLSL